MKHWLVIILVLIVTSTVSALQVGVNGKAVAGFFCDFVGGEGASNPTDEMTEDTTPIMARRLRADIDFSALFSPDLEFDLGFTADDANQNPSYSYTLSGDGTSGYSFLRSNARRYVSLNIRQAMLSMRNLGNVMDVGVGLSQAQWGAMGYYNYYRNDIAGRYYLADLDFLGLSLSRKLGFMDITMDAGSGYQGEPVTALKLSSSNLMVTFAAEGLYYDPGTIWDNRFRQELPPYWQTAIGRETGWRENAPVVSGGFAETWHAGAEYFANTNFIETALLFAYHSFKGDPSGEFDGNNTVWECYPDFLFHFSPAFQVDLAAELSGWTTAEPLLTGETSKTQSTMRVFFEPAWTPNETLLIGLGAEYVDPSSNLDNEDTDIDESTDFHIAVIPHILYRPQKGVDWDTRVSYKIWDPNYDIADIEYVDGDRKVFIPGTSFKESESLVFSTKCVVSF